MERSPSSPLQTPFGDYVEPLLQLCGEAVARILFHYDSMRSHEHDTKDDCSPLTAADLDSHGVLTAGLEPLELPVLSEESDAATRAQARAWQRYWLVDPLDGTKEFLARTGEFTVNIALVEEQLPVFGVVALPLAGELYLGAQGWGAWVTACPGQPEERGGNWRPIHSRTLRPDQPARVLTSRRHRGAKLDACLERVREHVGAVERVYVGSALKFCQLAAGEADFYPRFSPCSEWDTAAGQAVLEGAGGRVVDLKGNPLRYNSGESLLNPHFLAIADPGAGLWSDFLE